MRAGRAEGERMYSISAGSHGPSEARMIPWTSMGSESSLSCAGGNVSGTGVRGPRAGGGEGDGDLEPLRQACGEAVEIPLDAGVGGDEALWNLRGYGTCGRLDCAWDN